MSVLDWVVLVLTLLLVVLYGIYKGRATKDIDGYFRSSRQLPWYMVMLSVIGTQASAVTFLSGPGQAYTDGMRFVQYYFGLPLAMIVLCITFVPIFHKLNIYTAYEFLEKRFDRKTRTLAAFLFCFPARWQRVSVFMLRRSFSLQCWVGISISPTSSWEVF